MAEKPSLRRGLFLLEIRSLASFGVKLQAGSVMTNLDHYQKIRSQPYKAHELWQQTLVGQALKRAANLPENLPDQLAMSPQGRILF